MNTKTLARIGNATVALSATLGLFFAPAPVVGQSNSGVSSIAPRISVRVAETASAQIRLRQSAFPLSEDRETGGAGRALASADFDEDGVPDLVTGYADGEGGRLVVQRGNVDAIYPNSPEANARRARGEFMGAAFHSARGSFALAEAADFLGAGDFDADGHWDIITAARGGTKLYWLRGDGRGNFDAVRAIDVAGAVTALTAGEVNRRDGLTDLAVGIAAADGARVLVFEGAGGALSRAPESFAVAAPAVDLAFGELDDDAFPDLAIASGSEVVVVHGRDRRLSLDAEAQAAVGPANLTRSGFEAAVLSIAIGDFTGDVRKELAALTADRVMTVLDRDGSRTLTMTSESGVGRILALKVSALAKDDLLLFGGSNEVRIATTREPDRRDAAGTVAAEGSPRLAMSASVSAESAIAAVLPMRLNSDALKDLVLMRVTGGPAVVESHGTPFVVNTTAITRDAAPGNGICADSTGACSFIAAIEESNAHAGADTIHFNIPGGGVPRVSTHFPGAVFSDLNKPVTIDGTTQPGGRVEINSDGFVPLGFYGGNSVLRGVAIYGQDASLIVASANNIIEGNYVGFRPDGSKPSFGHIGGIDFSVQFGGNNNLIGGTTAQARNVISNCHQALSLNNKTGNVIQGNYVGLTIDGTAALANDSNLRAGFSSDVTIGGATAGAGNVFSAATSGSLTSGFFVSGGAVIQGNRFGTTPDGMHPIANTGYAIAVFSNEAVTIGGTTPAARNVMGASHGGIYFEHGSGENTLVQGNYIGTNAEGTGALPNRTAGMTLYGTRGVVVGGSVAGAGNLISGNTKNGLDLLGGINGTPCRGVVIQGNLIGTDVSGTLALPNEGDGIEASRADATLIGGTSAAARNTISGNLEHGLVLGSHADPRNSPLRVEGNYIGTNRFGTGPLGNGQNGVFMSGNISGNNIGGSSAGASNLIAHNLESGIASDRGYIGGAVLSNSIHSNAELGIDTEENGVSPISFESDINRPELLSIENTEAGTVITGKIYTYGSLEPFLLQFFSNSACDPSGYGEGQTLVGQTTVPAPTRYTYHDFSHTISPALPGGVRITAVNIRESDPANFPGQFFTSEFSNCIQSAAPTPTPTPSATPGASPTPTSTPTGTPNPTPTPTPTPSPTATPTPLQLFVIAPARGGDAQPATRQLTGQGLLPGATAKLTRAGEPDIVGTGAVVTNNGTTLTATFDLTGKARGLWSVVVTNPGGASAILPDAFTIGEPRAANVWIDVIGRFKMRLGRTQKFYIAYGNTGDVDSEPTMIRIHIPKGLSVLSMPVLEDGSWPAQEIQPDGLTLIFFVPKVAASNSTHLPMMLKTEDALAHTNVTIRAWAMSSASFAEEVAIQPDPAIQSTSTLLANTENHRKAVVKYTRGAETQEMTYEVSITDDTQPREFSFRKVKEGDKTRYTYEMSVPSEELRSSEALKSLGMSRLDNPHYERITVNLEKIDYDFPWLPVVTRDEVTTYRVSIKTLRLWQCALKILNIPENDPQAVDLLRSAEGLGVMRQLWQLDVKVTQTHGLFGITPPPTKALVKIHQESLIYPMLVLDALKLVPLSRTQTIEDDFLELVLRCSDCQGRIPIYWDHLGMPQSFAKSLPDTTTLVQATCTGGQRAADHRSNSHSTLPACQSCRCDRFKNILLNIVHSQDPNDKFGPKGAEAAHFITGAEPSSYAIFFENKPEATAPAQDVVVTDQLDVSKFDLSTFQLGPVSFGKDTFVAPPAGLSQWTTDIDLRPANNLIVRINAGLNPQTGVVRWAFTSLDPATMQPTDDPLAGFLPPNKTAPEGEGSVLFTVAPKPELQTGTEIRNDARIVFDVNAPIDTPEWLNTIDNSPPASQVEALPTTSGPSHFEVRWSGSDAGAGIESYSIYVSENGGPFVLWLLNTPERTGIFQGRPGSNYTFYSVAYDGAGNVEAPPGPADAGTITLSGQLLNIATRLRVQTGENVLIGGLIITGSEAKRVIIRGIGPSLSQLFEGALVDPVLELYQGNTLLASNDNWKDSQQAEIEATTIPPTHGLESAIVQTLAPGFYTAVMSGNNGGTGIGVVEAYDLDPATNSKLANIATRGFVDSGDNVMIGGVIAGGNGGADTRVLIRAIGPSLANAGINGALQDPTLELRNANGALLRENDNWQADQQSDIEATTIPPSNAAESAIVATLAPGAYTAIVRGKYGTTGVGLVEVYNIE